jgi:hypothetical protein
MARRMHQWLAMKKSTNSKLTLRTQVIRQLTNDVLDRVAGGFIMKDTIIIRTSTRVAPVEDVG